MIFTTAAGVSGAVAVILAAMALLQGMLATIECEVTQMVEAGDHVVVIGAALHATWREGQPLVYFNSSYQSLRSGTSVS